MGSMFNGCTNKIPRVLNCSCGPMDIAVGAYQFLLNDEDREMLPWIKRFQKFDLYSKSTEVPNLSEVMDYYKRKIQKLVCCMTVTASVLSN